MGNDMPCKTIGISSIKIWMHDGIVRTLINVACIRVEEESHFIEKKLDDNSYKFSGEDEVLRVSKDSLVLMKEKKVNTLYILQGSTLTGTTAMV